mgnify:FL=1
MLLEFCLVLKGGWYFITLSDNKIMYFHPIIHAALRGARKAICESLLRYTNQASSIDSFEL